MMELSVDTSTHGASVALSEQGVVLTDFSWVTARNHTRELVPNILRLVGEQGAKIGDIKSVAVAIGPGSFNGLRVGITTAKGLAFALRIPLIGIGTLELMAYPHMDCGLPICSILPMGRTEIAAAVFAVQNGRYSKVVGEHLTTISDLSARLSRKTAFCGDIRPEDRTRLQAALGPEAVFPDPSPARSRAFYLAEMAWCRIKMGESDDPSTLHPLYLRKPSITKPVRRGTHALSDMWTGSQGRS